MAKSVNFVWNYCNSTSFKAIKDDSKWLNWVDLCSLVAGSSEELKLNSQSIQSIAKEYAQKRSQFKRRKLNFRASRGPRKSIGWIPINPQSIKLDAKGVLTFMKRKYKTFYSRPIEGKIKCGSFNEDSQGNWYVNLTCEVQSVKHYHPKESVGIDPGLKATATLSDGYVVENTREFKHLQARLAKAQKFRKKRLARAVNLKIKRKRLDYLHKESTVIARTYRTIYVGNVSGKFLQSSNGKSTTDASIGLFRTFLSYKAIRHSGMYVLVNEQFSTVTCSACLEKTGPSGLGDLGVREWTCNCGRRHVRDVNAAKNILRTGHGTLRLPAATKGASSFN